MTDYQCWCLWDVDTGLNIDPARFSLSAKLEESLEEWSENYDSALNWDDPGNSYTSREWEIKHVRTGYELLEQLKKELPGIEFCYRVNK